MEKSIEGVFLTSSPRSNYLVLYSLCSIHIVVNGCAIIIRDKAAIGAEASQRYYYLTYEGR